MSVINLKQLKSLIDIAHYRNDDPHCMSWQLLCQRLSSHVWQRGCFSGWIQNITCVVLSCLSQAKHSWAILSNTCFISEPYSLPMVSLETVQSGWFHECSYAPAETTKRSFNQSRCVSLSSVYALSIKGSIMRHVQTDGSTKCKHFHYLRNFHLKGGLQTKTQHTIEKNKSAFLSTILLLPEFRCSRKLISIFSRSRPRPASRPVSHVTKTQHLQGAITWRKELYYFAFLRSYLVMVEYIKSFGRERS